MDWTPSPFELSVERRADGTLLLRPKAELAPYPRRVTDMLEHWAAKTPESIFVARRGADGAWQRVSYSQALERVRSLASGLAPLDLSAERPLLILSGNSIEHLLLGLAAMYLGVPYAPVSPAYSQASSDLSRLRYVVDLLTPGLVAAFGGGPYVRAIKGVVPSATTLLGDSLEIAGRNILNYSDLVIQAPAAVASLHQRTGPDTIAKFLLTSGSAGQPKAVITTQRMLCSNQIMLREALPFVSEEPPVIVDWLPWNHTFGGSHNVGLVLFNGGSLYIDDGKPVPKAFSETIRNLREISPTIYFNVPKGFEMLAMHLHQDSELQENFYRRLRVCFFGGASLSQHTWDTLDAAARAAGRNRIPILSGLGATETSPSVTFTTPDNDKPASWGGRRLEMLSSLCRSQINWNCTSAVPMSRPATGAFRSKPPRRLTKRASIALAMQCVSWIRRILAADYALTVALPRTSNWRAEPGSAWGRCARSCWRPSFRWHKMSSSRD